jgi:hypothetical protein
MTSTPPPLNSTTTTLPSGSSARYLPPSHAGKSTDAWVLDVAHNPPMVAAIRNLHEPIVPETASLSGESDLYRGRDPILAEAFKRRTIKCDRSEGLF